MKSFEGPDMHETKRVKNYQIFWRRTGETAWRKGIPIRADLLSEYLRVRNQDGLREYRAEPIEEDELSNFINGRSE